MASTPSHRASSSSHAPDCHLCESARRVIDAVRAEIEFELVETDISGDDELEARYRERIPVVLVNGEEAFTYFVHPDAAPRKAMAAHKSRARFRAQPLA